jgi:hypothetical protein
MCEIWDLLFGPSGGEKDDVSRWTTQRFHFNAQFPYVLQQDHGGPCGVLAVVQAMVLKRVLFDSGASVHALDELERIDELSSVLTDVLGDMLKAVAEEGTPIILHANQPGEFVHIDSIDLSAFTVLDFVASLITCRGVDAVKADMDDPETPLIGRFGHCSQELLNLLLFRRSTSNVFDGAQFICEGMAVRGVPEEAELDIGLLSELEVMRYVTVSDRLKNPNFPFWIIGSPSHYTLVFSFDRLASAVEAGDALENRIRRAFNAHALDEGIALGEKVPAILAELSLTSNAFLDSSIAEGVLLYSDFLKWAQSELEGDESISPPKKKPQVATATTLYFLDGQNPPAVYRVVLGGSQTDSSPATDSLERILRTRWASIPMAFEKL